MERKYIDCREYPSESSSCSVMISANNEEELLEAAVQHAVSSHHEKDTPELRDAIRKMMKSMPVAKAA